MVAAKLFTDSQVFSIHNAFYIKIYSLEWN